ncbi:hypothetical protein RBH26_17330 [Natronolimnohabitans sp. A-GB9]|uniref:hypothetical protein n=1 Tax=Natronolimnohabitans sp. A-GB9 TaxID=3069757 RepID=UPI0027B83770|nr:hypothetical protein [Natronolimnohabitans sp. A-GB9]MDQ2052238.1 hypothetical protein [Natronolimnohabitans sp. A-GB9]
MRSTALYAGTAVTLALLTMIVLATHGSGSYMFVLYGGILAVVFAGFAYDDYTADSGSVTARAR